MCKGEKGGGGGVMLKYVGDGEVWMEGLFGGGGGDTSNLKTGFSCEGF